MGRALKWIIGIFAGVIVAVIVVVYIILASYDFNDLKPHLGRKRLLKPRQEITPVVTVNLRNLRHYEHLKETRCHLYDAVLEHTWTLVDQGSKVIARATRAIG